MPVRDYAVHLPSRTPHRVPIPELEMVQNAEGGFVFPVTDRTRGTRWLTRGSDDDTYYAKRGRLTRENMTAIDRLIEDGDGEWLVDELVRISEEGRAPKAEPAILALARCLAADVPLPVRKKAGHAAPRVIRAAAFLPDFMDAGRIFRGRGFIFKKAVQAILQAWDADRMAYQAIKYQERNNWTLARALKLARPKPSTPELDQLYRWIVGKADAQHPQVLAFLEARQLRADNPEHEQRAIDLVLRHDLPWEALPTKFHRNRRVMEAVLYRMPMVALMRHLGHLTSIGVLEPDSAAARVVAHRFGDAEKVRKARLHPIKLYLAARQYGAGRQQRGQQRRDALTWRPVREIEEALDTAFFHSLGAVEATGQRMVVAVDCSGSMTMDPDVWGIPNFRAAEIAMVMAYAVLRTEPRSVGIAFDITAIEFDLNRVRTTADLKTKYVELARQLHRGTNCAAPIEYAMKQRHLQDVEAFVINTDGESYDNARWHPIEAVSHYREQTGIPTRLVTVAYVANGHALTPWDDAGSMAVCGFDADALDLISGFLSEPSPRIPGLGSRSRRGGMLP